MKYRNTVLNINFALVTFSLTACVTTEEDKQSYLQLSCYELAKEIGRTESIIENAKFDGVISDIEFIVTDDKKREKEAAIDGMFSDLDQDMAQELLNTLKEIEYKKSCSNK